MRLGRKVGRTFYGKAVRVDTAEGMCKVCKRIIPAGEHYTNSREKGSHWDVGGMNALGFHGEWTRICTDCRDASLYEGGKRVELDERKVFDR